jgi:hypothetical protein
LSPSTLFVKAKLATDLSLEKMATDGRPAVVELGERAVVLRAEQADVHRAVIAAHAERQAVVELELLSLGAALALPVDEAAALAVALAHRAPHRGGNVAPATGCVGPRERLARSDRLSETPGFQPFERVA